MDGLRKLFEIFFGSPEYLNRSLTPRGIVALLYSSVLGRDGFELEIGSCAYFGDREHSDRSIVNASIGRS
jgi:hypothetical protein